LEQIAALTLQVRHLDRAIENLGERDPEIRILRTVPALGPILATAYVLTRG